MNTLAQSTPIDEETLVRRARNGDLEAFNQLVLTYQDAAYNHARALLNDRHLAEDAAQESFIKAFQGLGAFRGGSFRGWLLKIVTNSAYDILRRSHRHPTQPLYPGNENSEEIESPPWLADPNPSVHSIVEQREATRRLYRLLDELPDPYRSVISLVDIHEMDYAGAAQALSVPVGTVKSRLARARLQLKEKLEGTFEQPKHASLCIGVNALC